MFSIAKHHPYISYHSTIMRHIQAVSPLMVAASGAGSTRQAPHRSTMQRFLMRTKVTMLFLMSLLVILRITLQLVTILISSMRTMTAHCRGCENMNTAPLVRSEAGEAAMLILELQTNHRRSFHNHRGGLLLVESA